MVILKIENKGCHTRNQQRSCSRLPQVPAAVCASTQTFRHVRGILWVFIIAGNTGNVIKRQLFALQYIPKGEERKVVNMFVRVITHTRKYLQVWITGVVDEACWSRHELPVYLQGRALKAGIQGVRIGKLVQRKQIDVFSLCDCGFSTATVGLSRCDDFTKVAIDKLALFDSLSSPHT